jgi:1,4-alpha-glucan branching enzyme
MMPHPQLTPFPHSQKMKTKRTPNLVTADQPAPVAHLEFHDPHATSVCVAGTFNDWRPEASPMIALAQGRWIKELALPPGRYEYCLVVDGDWRPDPRAGEDTPNPFGGLNSVLFVTNPSAAGNGHSRSL